MTDYFEYILFDRESDDAILEYRHIGRYCICHDSDSEQEDLNHQLEEIVLFLAY